MKKPASHVHFHDLSHDNCQLYMVDFFVQDD